MDQEEKTLTKEEFRKHKDNDKFIHEVAYAHGVQGWDNHFKALCKYVTGSDYKVSFGLQLKAYNELKKRKQAIVNNIGNKLVFVGMGSDFTPSTVNHIGNHRIRTYFTNNDGVLCFVEFGASIDKNFLRCDHGLMHTKKENSGWNSLPERENTEKRISIESIKGDYIQFTKQNVLNLVNKHFNCSFKEVEVYSYFLSTSDYTSISKKVV